jgi:hypothetical protein
MMVIIKPDGDVTVLKTAKEINKILKYLEKLELPNVVVK